jgi:hypothetical protein
MGDTAYACVIDDKDSLVTKGLFEQSTGLRLLERKQSRRCFNDRYPGPESGKCLT